MSVLFCLFCGLEPEKNEPSLNEWLKTEEQRDVFTGADHVLLWTCFGQREDSPMVVALV